MADGKYGRIYTEADVRRIAHSVALDHGGDEESSNHALQEALGAHGAHTRFPANEPLFIMRAQDVLTPATVRTYRDLCERRGLSTEHLVAVDNTLRDIDEWQAAHPDKLKLPD